MSAKDMDTWRAEAQAKVDATRERARPESQPITLTIQPDGSFKVEAQSRMIAYNDIEFTEKRLNEIKLRLQLAAERIPFVLAHEGEIRKIIDDKFGLIG
jgi:hypothetical protein